MSRGVYTPSLHAGIRTPPVNRMTDRCKNITSPQLRLRAVKIVCCCTAEKQLSHRFGDACDVITFFARYHFLGTL